MVRVLDDADVVQQLQKGHGGWIEGMSKVSFVAMHDFPARR